MSPNNNQLGKSRRYSGALEWMNDIEVHVGAYLSAALFLIAGMFLVNQPLFEVSAPYLGTVSVATREIPGLEWANGVMIVLNLAALFMLIFPMLKFFEWKYRWFLAVLAVFGTEAVAVFVVLLKKEELVGDTLVNAAMELLSVEISVTGYTWMLLVVSVLGVGAALKMVLDINKNKQIYMYE